MSLRDALRVLQQRLPGDLVVGLSSSFEHTCVVLESGGVMCWGGDDSGQLGDGGGPGDVSSSTPVDVFGISTGAVDVAAGTSFSCASLQSGAARCWGANWVGALGDDGTNQSSPVPVDVVGLP